MWQDKPNAAISSLAPSHDIEYNDCLCETLWRIELVEIRNDLLLQFLLN